jgi:hypothetical protein
MRRARRTAAGSFLSLAAVVAVTVLASCGQPGGSGSGTSPAQSSPAQASPARTRQSQGQPAPADFGWFRERPAPGGWHQAALAARRAVLSYPGSLRPMPGDRGTVTVGLTSPAGATLVYLNVTPRQGSETLRDWPTFRLAHLREDGDTAVRLDAASATLPFRGGHGRCVVDDYITRIRSNHYREIACFVQAAGDASVLIAATPAAAWGRYGALLERVVSGYAVN